MVAIWSGDLNRFSGCSVRSCMVGVGSDDRSGLSGDSTRLRIIGQLGMIGKLAT